MAPPLQLPPSIFVNQGDEADRSQVIRLGALLRAPDAAEALLAVIAAGADVLVAGSATFKDGPARYAENIRLLRGQG